MDEDDKINKKWISELDNDFVLLGDKPKIYDIPEIEGGIDRHFKPITKIGKGGFCVVFLAECKEKKEFWAIKRQKNGGRLQPDKYWSAEYEILRRLNHPSIIKIHSLFKTCDGKNNLVMEYFPGVELDLFVRDWKKTHHSLTQYKLPIRYQQMIIDGLLEGIKYLHENHIVHRDLKPSNVLINLPLNKIKIVDFAFSGYVKSDIDDRHIANHRCNRGTPLYMGKEMICSEVCPDVRMKSRLDLMKAEIWALGILIHFIVVGCEPYNAISIKEFIKLMRSPPPINYEILSTTQNYKRLMTQCLRPDYKDRPTADELYKYYHTLSRET